MIKIAIIGTGQIGLDLLYKLMKLDYVKIIAFVGKRKLTKPIPKNIFYTNESINYFILNPNCCHVVFDCTDAFSALKNSIVFLEQNIKIIDLTPSNIGKFYIPNMNCIIEQNINMVTCGGQASIPLIKYLHDNSSTISYVEVVTQISSESAGMATRINIDKYIETTETAINKFCNISNCKVILNINPCKTTTMQTTVYIKTSNYNNTNLNEFIKSMDYIPNYIISNPIWISNNILMTNINIISSGDYISNYFGNLDIINCAAIHALKTIYKQFYL